MINTLEQRKWSWLQEDSRPMMPGVSGCWSSPSGAGAFGTAVSSPGAARFLALSVTENACLKRSNPPQTHFHGHFRRNLVT